MTLSRLCRILSATALATLVVSGAHAQQKTIGFAAPNLAASFWISGAYGIDDEAKKLGVNLVKLNAGGDANVSQQISQIQDLMQRKVDAIIVGATNGEAVKAVVEQAIAQGIPVIGLSSPPATPKLSSIVSADHYDMGRLQAQCLAKSLGGKGNVAMVAGPAGQVWADRRAAGFKETVAKEFPDVKVIAESRMGDNRNQALTTAEDWIQRFPDMNGVYAATDDMAAGVVSALKSAKKMDKVRVSASNLSPTAQQLLRDGDLVCTSIQQVVTQGRNALCQAVAAANKSGNDARVVLPAVLVTRENMETVDLSGVVAPASYRP